MPPSKFSRRDSFSPARSIVAMTSALRDIHIDYETMLIESIATDTTAYCTKPHWAASVLLPVRAGRSTKYLTPGQRVIVRWEDGYGQRRFIDAGSRLGQLGDDGEEFLGLWVRQEARRTGRFWLGNPEVSVITAGEVTPVEDRPVQGPLRSYGDFLTWAADSTLTEYEPATGASTETEHTGPIVAVWDDGETWVLTQVDTTPAGYDEGYSDGYAATEGTGPGSPYNEAANACLNETPYDPSGSNPGPPEVEGTEEYIDGYNAGWASGWQINYDLGYTEAGCTIPEE